MKTIDLYALRKLVEVVSVDKVEIARCCVSLQDWIGFGGPEYLIVNLEDGEHSIPISVDATLRPGQAIFDGKKPD